MTFGELITYKANEVRSNSNLTLYFIEGYREVFGSAPSCSGCAINNEFDKFINQVKIRNLHDKEIEVLINKVSKMEDSKTFQLSAKVLGSDITMLAYTDNKGIRRRKFLNLLKDEFVIGYLTHGTEEELEERRKQFKVLPLALREENKEQVEDTTDVTEVTEDKPKRGRKSKKNK